MRVINIGRRSRSFQHMVRVSVGGFRVGVSIYREKLYYLVFRRALVKKISGAVALSLRIYFIKNLMNNLFVWSRDPLIIYCLS